MIRALSPSTSSELAIIGHTLDIEDLLESSLRQAGLLMGKLAKCETFFNFVLQDDEEQPEGGEGIARLEGVRKWPPEDTHQAALDEHGGMRCEKFRDEKSCGCTFFSFFCAVMP